MLLLLYSDYAKTNDLIPFYDSIINKGYDIINLTLVQKDQQKLNGDQ